MESTKQTHEANSDPSVVLVWTRRCGDVYHSVYKTQKGFVATAAGVALPGYFDTQKDAWEALAA